MFRVLLSPAAFAVAHEAVRSFEIDPIANPTLDEVEVFTDVRREAEAAFDDAARLGPRGDEA